MAFTPLYSDFDLGMAKNALSGDIMPVINETAVRRCIMRIPSVRRFDIPFRPDTSCFLEEFLFDASTVSTAAAIQDRVSWALKKMEPRAEYVIDVTPSADLLGYSVRVKYEVKSLMITGDVTIYIERVR